MGRFYNGIKSQAGLNLVYSSGYMFLYLTLHFVLFIYVCFHVTSQFMKFSRENFPPPYLCPSTVQVSGNLHYNIKQY